MIKLKVVCIGEGMAFCLERLEKKYSSHVSFTLIDTDVKSLMQRNISNKLLIGGNTFFGLGSCANASSVTNSLDLDIDNIRASLKGADVVVVISALGGGTGSGAVNALVLAARSVGANVITFVSKPVKLYGNRSVERAELAIEQLKKNSDQLLVLDNNIIVEIERKGWDIQQKILLRRLNTIYYVICSKIIKVIIKDALMMKYRTISSLYLWVWLGKYVDRLIQQKNNRVLTTINRQGTGFTLHKNDIITKWPPKDYEKMIPPWLVPVR